MKTSEMWRHVAKLNDIAEGASQIVELGGRQIALFKSGGTIYAIDNICPHQGGPLGEGFLDGAVVTCPWHAWQFNIKTGACESATDISQRTFPVKIEGDDIWVELTKS